MTGLKINVEKSRAIWIGAKRFSNDRLCQHYKLDWGQGPFKNLGVNFSANVNEIWNINTHDIIFFFFFFFFFCRHLLPFPTPFFSHTVLYVAL